MVQVSSAESVLEAFRDDHPARAAEQARKQEQSNACHYHRWNRIDWAAIGR